jgi:5-oxoprolinase (ATP-hydrolysing)
MKLVSRGDTTVVDAYLSPILRRYVDQVAAQMPGVRLFFMQSSGGLTEAHHFQGKDAILSGPAGGIVGMVRTAVAGGHGKVIGFDMGGTSTDVSHYAGEFERAFETQVAGVRMRAPMMSIHTVAAGGGQHPVVRRRAAARRALKAPAPTPARPATAAAARWPPPTPTCCWARSSRRTSHGSSARAADEALDRDGVAQRFTQLAAQVQQATGRETTPESLAEGFLQIAVQNMANAIKRISVARGYDVTQYTLQCFGGAGGQHACGVADALGMSRVFVHPLAGVLSAYGMGLADQIAMREASVEQPLDAPAWPRRGARCSSWARPPASWWQPGRGPRGGRAAPPHACALPGHRHRAGGRLRRRAAIQAAFEAGYRQRFAFLMPDRALVIEAVSVEAVAAGERHAAAGERGARAPPGPDGARAHAQRRLARRRPVRARVAAAPVR